MRVPARVAPRSCQVRVSRARLVGVPVKLDHVTSVLARFAAIRSDWGFGAASTLVFRSKVRPSGEMAATLSPPGCQFWFRGIDRPVLSQFGRDFGIIDTSAGAPIRTIVDAGANIGVFSAVARRMYPDATIIALEAERSNFAVLEKNARALGRVEPLFAALWREDGHVELVRGEDPEGHWVRAGGDERTGIPAISLPTLMNSRSWKTIDLLKMDIEGAEDDVLCGLSEEHLRTINAVRVECNDNDAPGTFLRVAQRLSAEEFDSFAFDENVYFIRRSTGWRFRRKYAGVGTIPTFAGENG